jgi:hypothetical protein
MKKAGLTAKEVEAKLQELCGNMAAVARYFGVTRQAVWDFVHRRARLQQVAADIREGMKDHAESSLYAAVLRGEAWAVCFFLKTQARDRGYTERQEHHHSGPSKGGAIPLTVENLSDAELDREIEAIEAEEARLEAGAPPKAQAS